MAKIDRHVGNLTPFAKDAPEIERGTFGSGVQSDLLIDNLNALFGEGWADVTSPTLFPKLRDFNAAMFTATQLIAYMMQTGIPEYHVGQTYYLGNMCSKNGIIYVSQTDDNTNNLLTDGAFWKDVLTDGLATKQDTLVSGTDIKTINGLSILNAGNVDIGVGQGQNWSEITPMPNVNNYNLSGRPIVMMVADEITPVSDRVNGLPIDEVHCRTFIIPDGQYIWYSESYDTVLKLTE